MESIEKSVDVNVPVRTAYDQWTQFEQFPRFMEGVEEVRQMGDTMLHWRASIAGKQEEWDAEITDQVPDQLVAWRSTGGAENSGRVAFMSLGPARTRVTVTMGYAPEGVVEKAGNVLGIVDRRVEGDLKRFKTFIEERGVETGAWRGEVHRGTVETESTGV